MGLMTGIKARNAATLQSKGDIDGAMKLYQEAISEGLNTPRYLLSYSVLLLRTGRYQEARELLVKIQKSPLLTPDQRITLFVNYAATVYRLGDIQKGIDVLERQHAKQPTGLIYETLGYLYVEAGDKDKALSFNLEAMDYDDEDSITLDNLGQTYYRLLGDREKAREYFQKALEQKSSQIDTLYFLAKMDIEDGNNEAARQKLETASKGRFSPLNHATQESVQALLNTLA